MSSNSTVLVKRKRFQYVNNTESNVPFQELLDLASNFAKSDDSTDQTKWLGSAASRVDSTLITSDMIFLFPAEKGDNGECIDDKWAMTSNWIFYTILSNDSTSTYIKLIGSMFPQEDFLFTEKLTKVTLPEFLIVAKNDTEEQGRTFMLKNASIEEEGEEKSPCELIKKVSLYGIQDLDNTPRPCSLKNEGIKRMLVVAGIIRLMGMERFERLVVDLRYCRRSFMDAVERYVASAQTLPTTSIFKSFIKQPTLKGLPVIDDVEILEKLLLGNYPLYDRTQISLGSFIRNKMSKYLWKNTPTREGRTLFLEAFTNLQKVLVVYYGTHYSTCCSEVLEILDEDEDILRTFNDSYIQIRFEVALSHFFQDVYRERKSLMHPEISMDSPMQCAALLKRYLSDQVKGARGQHDKDYNWEGHPHSFFYSSEGEFQKISFTKINETGKSKEPAIGKHIVEQELCLWHLGSLIQVDMSNGKRVECRNKDTCKNKHKTISNITKHEAASLINKMNGGKLKSSFEQKIALTTGFKKSANSPK